MVNQPVMYGEHTNIQCIAVFNGAASAKPCSIVRISNLPDKSSPMKCNHSNCPRYHNGYLQNHLFYCC